MKMQRSIPAALLFSLLCVASCSMVDDMPSLDSGSSGKKVGFDISVTREGEAIPQERTTKASESFDASDKIATMDTDLPFGLIGIDYDNHEIVVDNERVGSSASGYNTVLTTSFWKDLNTQNVAFSAYYPYVSGVGYGDELETYSIPYTAEQTSAGPLVSKTVQKAVALLDVIPLEFQHITNDIGYRICDITPVEELQGLIHLRKLTAYHVASAGIFVNDIASSMGVWHRQGYYRDIVVFEGDAKVGVGSENEMFVGRDALESRMRDSHRYYSIPDEIKLGWQFVEAVFDVEGFTLNGFDYPPLTNQKAKFNLYGVLPGNEFVYGRQYTFHLGLDLTDIYKEITFAPSVTGWETKIYENNDEF